MSKHTPGPWREAKWAAVFGAIISDVRPADRPPSKYEAEEVKELGGYLIAESVTRSNRPLIAAAPDMYEALERLLEAAEAWANAGYMSGTDESHEAFDAWQRANLDAYDALAKARGERV